jgi:hypothetical protein
MIGKDLTENDKGRIGSGRTILTFGLRNCGKPRRTSLRIYGFPVKFRSGYLTNVSHDLYSSIRSGRHVHVILGKMWWSRGSVLAFGTQVRGFKPGRSRRIFRAKKYSARLLSEGK